MTGGSRNTPASRNKLFTTSSHFLLQQRRKSGIPGTVNSDKNQSTSKFFPPLPPFLHEQPKIAQTTVTAKHTAPSPETTLPLAQLPQHQPTCFLHPKALLPFSPTPKPQNPSQNFSLPPFLLSTWHQTTRHPNSTLFHPHPSSCKTNASAPQPPTPQPRDVRPATVTPCPAPSLVPDSPKLPTHLSTH